MGIVRCKVKVLEFKKKKINNNEVLLPTKKITTAFTIPITFFMRFKKGFDLLPKY